MTDKSKKILSEISAGELLDKISILEIKLGKIKDKEDQKEINKEYKILKDAQNSTLVKSDKIDRLFNQIKNVNIALWDIEDKLRVCEKNKDFSENFIKLARGVYFTNDKRANLKAKINKVLGSNIKEIKQYVDY